MEWETFREFGRLTEVRGMFITPVSAREDKQEKIYFVVYRYISNRKIRNHNETAVAGRKDHLGETGRTLPRRGIAKSSHGQMIFFYVLPSKTAFNIPGDSPYTPAFEINFLNNTPWGKMRQTI